MTVAASAFASESRCDDVFTLGKELDAIGFGDFVPIRVLLARVPHRKNQTPLGGAVHLHVVNVAPA